MRISFHGADQDVTGSCHLVTCAGRRILIDCGMFQGGRELDEDNAEPFGFDPAEIDFLLLTHAHLDHCGRIPLLVQRGFRGEIITTAATRELTRLVLLDSAHLHEEEAKRRSRKRREKEQSKGGHSKRGHARQTEAPLYDTLDALNSFDCFGRTARYRKPFSLGPGITATFHNAGHILGSASILLELAENDVHRRVLFSGDIGNSDRALLDDPDPPGNVDIVIMETTYGDRNHQSLDASVREFYDAVTDAYDRGGNVIIPTFALERAQELLFYLNEGMRGGTLPGDLRVFLDSPMAISATEIFRNHPDSYRSEIRALFEQGRDPFKLPDLEFVREASDSMLLNRIRSGAVIMAGSGMCTGGRVRHHLRHNLAHADCSVIFVGFAAEGTLARIIIDGAKSVKLFGEEIPVKARIHTINGFSAHADKSELLNWHARTGKPQRTFLVHGESEKMKKFAQSLRDTQVEMPSLHESFEL